MGPTAPQTYPPMYAARVIRLPAVAAQAVRARTLPPPWRPSRATGPCPGSQARTTGPGTGPESPLGEPGQRFFLGEDLAGLGIRFVLADAGHEVGVAEPGAGLLQRLPVPDADEHGGRTAGVDWKGGA